jgi:amino acid transporter
MTNAAAPSLRRELGLRDLVLFSLAGTIGIRWLPAAAQAGTSSVILWIAAAAFFFVPSAFAIGRLSARYPEEGGLYIWTRNCFGEWHGFLCFWLYWLGLTFWFPSALMAYTSMSVYALGPGYAALAGSHAFVLGASLIALWLVLGANLLGLGTAKWIDSAGSVSACLLGAMLVALALFAGSLPAQSLGPRWDWRQINFWSQMAYALTGLELAPILGGEIRDPARNLPRSGLLVAPLATLYYVISTLALVTILPPGGVNPMHGISQAISASGGDALGVPSAILIAIAATGQLSVLGAAAVRLPFVAGIDGRLPPALGRLHPRFRTPHLSILTFGLISSGFLILCQLGENLRAAYQTVTDLMVIGGFIPFLYIFAAAWKCGARWSAASGAAVSIFALACAVVPTPDVRSPLLFQTKLLGVTAVLVASARIVYKSTK